MKTKEEYLQSFGHCPHCDSTDIEGLAGYEGDGDWILQRVECKVCGATWTDDYTLTNYTMNYIPPLALQARWVSNSGHFDDNNRQIIEPASERAVLLGTAFVGLYQRNPITKEWEWMSDYKNAAELYAYTGIDESKIQLIGASE